jgi:hypothetical protein
MDRNLDVTAPGPSPESPEPERRNNKGQFIAGRPGPALKTGAYSQLIRSGEYAGSRELLAESREELYRDLGDDLPAVVRSMADAFIELGAVRNYLGSRLAAEGPLTAKGYTRALLTAYLNVIDRQAKLAQLLGLERRTKSVHPLDAVQRAVEDANK